MDTWTQVEVFTTTQGIEPLTAALMDLGISGCSIQDAADFEAFLEGKQGRWDYIDENLMSLRNQESSVTFYLADNAQGREQMAQAKEAFARLKALDTEKVWGRLELSTTPVREEDWANNWKNYWSPDRIGERLVVCPTWESWEESPGDVVLRLDPGMAFGSGAHHSTRMCLELLQEEIKGRERVLDLGCGSGILSVAALLLGASSARGTDIEEVAVQVARENAVLNGVGDLAQYSVGNLAQGITGTFDIVFANIVADIILRLVPDLPRLLNPGGVVITSGIIDARSPEVEEALAAAGFTLSQKKEQGGWVALLARPA